METTVENCTFTQTETVDAAELAALRKDAELYRWLREQIEAGKLTIAKTGGWDGLEPWSGGKPDEVIAAAMLTAPAVGAA